MGIQFAKIMPVGAFILQNEPDILLDLFLLRTNGLIPIFLKDTIRWAVGITDANDRLLVEQIFNYLAWQIGLHLVIWHQSVKQQKKTIGM